MTSPAARLRSLVARLPELGEDGAWMAARLKNYFDADDESARLDEALGLIPGPGQEHWRSVERRAERDAAIRALARETDGNAVQIREMILRYSGSAWSRDRALSACPARYEGTQRQHLFKAFKVADGDVPISAKQLRRILREGRERGAVRVPATARFSPADDRESQRVESHGPNKQRIHRGLARF